MLEEKKLFIYLSVSNGVFSRYMGPNQEPKTYGRVAGFVTEIFSSVRKIKDDDVKFLVLRLRDGDENISVQVPMYGSAGPDILRNLAFAAEKGYDFVTDAGQKVFLEAFSRTKDGRTYNNVVIYWGQTKLEWAMLPNGMSRNDALDTLMEEIRDFVLTKVGESGGAPEDMPAFGVGDAPEVGEPMYNE